MSFYPNGRWINGKWVETKRGPETPPPPKPLIEEKDDGKKYYEYIKKHFIKSVYIYSLFRNFTFSEFVHYVGKFCSDCPFTAFSFMVLSLLL